MKKLLIILPVALLVLLAAFLLLDFRLLKGQSSVISTIAASHSDGFSASRDLSPSVTGLYVEDNGAVAHLVAAHVKALLQNQPAISRVTPINVPADQMDIPVMYVELVPVTYTWTPVYATAEYQLTISYASNGDTSFRKDEVTHFRSRGDKPYLQFKATTTLKDTSFGIISLPGYRHYLADKLLEQVDQSLQSQFNG
jgi:hypothetical protein